MVVKDGGGGGKSPSEKGGHIENGQVKKRHREKTDSGGERFIRGVGMVEGSGRHT